MSDTKPPPGICDCHAHVYGPPTLYPTRPGARYAPPKHGLSDYQQMLARIGVDRAVVVQPTVYADNRATADALAASRGRWRGVAKFTDGGMEVDVAAMDRQGFRGVRVHGTGDARELARLEEIANRIASFGWHIQLHAEARHLAELESRLLRLPVPVVLDHFARVDPVEGADSTNMHVVLRLLASGRCWLKLSGYYLISHMGFPYTDLDPIVRALIAARPDRLVWGSNWPHPSHEDTPDEVALLGLLHHWGPDTPTRDGILIHNPATLYRF